MEMFGILESWVYFSFLPIIPPFHYSITPILHYSISPFLRYFSLVVGSPNRIHVFLTSSSPAENLALAVASPRVIEALLKSKRINSLFMAACPEGSVNPDEVQTATAPPWGALNNASAKGCA